MRIFWCCWLLACALAAKDPIPLETTIRSVRLHPSEAWITCVGTIQLPEEGVHRVTISKLPAGLKFEDLRIAARGPNGTRLGDLTVRPAPQTYRGHPEWKRLEREQNLTEKSIAQVTLQKENLNKARLLFRELKAVYVKAIQQKMSTEALRPQAVQDLSAAMEARDLELSRQETSLGEEEAKLEFQREQTRQAMEKFAGESETNPTVVSAELEVLKAGLVEVTLSYRTKVASWVPAYEARLSPDSTKLELVLFAAVRQDTGASWTNVDLELLSQDPSGSLDLPSSPDLPTLNYREGEAPKASIHVQENPVRSGSLSTLKVPGKVSIRAGEQQRFRLSSLDLSPRFRYLAMPRQGVDVYLLAMVFPTPNFPLVDESPVDMLQGTERLGTLKLEAPAPGEPLRLSYGPVPGLLARKEVLERNRTEVGEKTKEREWVVRERLIVESSLPNPVEVEVQDRIVISGTDSVKVDQDTGTTPGWDLSRNGLRSWVIRLGAAGKASVVQQTRIRGPLVGRLVNLGDLGLENN